MATEPRELDAASAARSDSLARGTLRALAALLARLSPRDFSVRLWNGQRLPPEAGLQARFELVLAHPTSLFRMLWPPGELAIAESFVRGDWDVEGDLVEALKLRDRFRPSPLDVAALAPLAPDLVRAAAARPGARSATLRGAKHSGARDADAIRHHYDLGNDFYALWLDRRMVYSCAYFPDPTASLDAAQEAKLELVCRKLRLRPGARLLDVGCGWGALVMHAAERHGVDALGVTLSPAQAEVARARVAARGLADRCRIEVVDYRALRAEPFDAIASVGMVEHVGVGELPTYFRRAAELLRPGGVFLNHGISPAEPRDRSLRSRVLREGQFIQRYVFPDTELPFLHETAAAAVEAGLELRDVESLREHYALTLRQWLARLEARRADAEALTTPTTFRVWRLYLAGAAAAFELGQNTVFQALYVRPDHGRSGLPLGRGDWHATPLP